MCRWHCGSHEGKEIDYVYRNDDERLGGGTVKVGSTSIAAAGSRTIDCGFAPDKVVLYLNNTGTNAQMTLVYDKAVIGTAYQFQGYSQGGSTGFNKVALPNTANNVISSVSGNNVTFKVNSNFVGTWYYIAYKA